MCRPAVLQLSGSWSAAHHLQQRTLQARTTGAFGRYHHLIRRGLSEATFYRWKQIYGGMGPSELRKMRQLEEENQKLKRLVADLSLDKAMLQEVLAKKV